MLPDPNSENFNCPRCSANLWFARFNAAGPRFLLAQKDRSLDDVLLDMAQPHDPDLVTFLRTPPEQSGVDSFDIVEMRFELLDVLERHLPELADEHHPL